MSIARRRKAPAPGDGSRGARGDTQQIVEGNTHDKRQPEIAQRNVGWQWRYPADRPVRQSLPTISGPPPGRHTMLDQPYTELGQRAFAGIALRAALLALAYPAIGPRLRRASRDPSVTWIILVRSVALTAISLE